MLRRQHPLWPNLSTYTDLIVALSQFGDAPPLSYSIPYGLSFNILCSLFQNDCSGERVDRCNYFLSFKQDNFFSIDISRKSKMGERLDLVYLGKFKFLAHYFILILRMGDNLFILLYHVESTNFGWDTKILFCLCADIKMGTIDKNVNLVFLA